MGATSFVKRISLLLAVSLLFCPQLKFINRNKTVARLLTGSVWQTVVFDDLPQLDTHFRSNQVSSGSRLLTKM
jgi:hypothetical protein